MAFNNGNDYIFPLGFSTVPDPIVPNRGDLVESMCLYLEDLIDETFELAEALEENSERLHVNLIYISHMMVHCCWEDFAKDYPGCWPDSVPLSFSQEYRMYSSFDADSHDFNACCWRVEAGYRWAWDMVATVLTDYFRPFLASRFSALPRYAPFIREMRGTEPHGFRVFEKVFVEGSLLEEWGCPGFPSKYALFLVDYKGAELASFEYSAKDVYRRYLEGEGEEKENPKIYYEWLAGAVIAEHMDELLSLDPADIWEVADDGQDWKSQEDIVVSECAGGLVSPGGEWVICSFGAHEHRAEILCSQKGIDAGEDALTYLIEEEGWVCLHKPSPALPWTLSYPSAYDTGVRKPPAKQKDALWDAIEEVGADTSQMSGLDAFL